jgi:hypothetical protein
LRAIEGELEKHSSSIKFLKKPRMENPTIALMLSGDAEFAKEYQFSQHEKGITVVLYLFFLFMYLIIISMEATTRR